MRRRTSRTSITLTLTVVLLAVLCAVPTMPLRAAPAVPFRPTGLDGGGLVNVVAFDPWTPGVVIAGGDNSGFYRSSDNGLTWTPQNAGIAGVSQLQVATIAFSPTVPGTIYAGVGALGAGGGVFVSTDDGRTWTLRSSVPQFSGAPNTGIAGVPAPHPRSTGTLIQMDGARGVQYVATFDDGVMRSSDGGASWTTLGLVGQHLRSLQIDPGDANVLYAATYGDGVWRTDAASTGGAFAKLASSPAIVEDLAVVGSDLYAVGPTGLFRSPDRGVTWATVGAGQLPTGGTGPLSTTPTWFTVTGYVSCGTTKLYVGGQFKGAASVMASSDGGATWSSLLGASAVRQTEGGPSGPTWWLSTNQLATLGGSNYLTTQIALDPASTAGGCTRQRVLVAGRAGIFGTIDAGATWYPMMRGLGLTVIRGIASDPHDPGRVYIAPADWAFASTTDGGASMTRNAPAAQVFDAFGVAADPSTTPSTVYLATGQFSSNTGEIWSNLDPASGGGWTNEGFAAAGGTRPTAVAVNRVGGQPVILVMAQSSGIWRKAGGVWSRVNTNVGGGGQPSFSWLPGSTVVSFYDHGTGVWRSNDAGQTWKLIWSQPSPADMTGFVAADPTMPSRLYVSVGGVGLFRLEGADVGTVDAGTIIAEPVGTLSAPGPIAVRSDGAIMAVELPGPSDGPAVVISTDHGATWSTISDAGFGATGGFVRVLASGPDASVWAGLFGDGLAMRPQPSFDLTVAAAGTGAGRVTSVPAGIDCPPACASVVGWGGAVTLSASPDAASTFAGWSGSGCTGTGACQFTMSQARSVTATFVSRYRPDAAVALGNGTFVGDGVYGANGAGQTVATTTSQARTVTFRVRIQNDGTSSDAFTIGGPGDSTGFRVRYLMGTADVTARVRAGTFQTASLVPGGGMTLTLMVSTLSGSRGRTNDVLVSARSVGRTALLDAVLARVTVR
jgi:hypothetical protein